MVVKRYRLRTDFEETLMIHRRGFLGSVGALSAAGLFSWRAAANAVEASARLAARELRADVVIVGASLGGCAAAIAALRNGLQVVMTEETDWIGGQLTSGGNRNLSKARALVGDNDSSKCIARSQTPADAAEDIILLVMKSPVPT
jgi:heterodisulfide reductase subunit A-like polyferredoxin